MANYKNNPNTLIKNPTNFYAGSNFIMHKIDISWFILKLVYVKLNPSC